MDGFKTVPIHRSALMFAGAVCADKRHSRHLLQQVADMRPDQLASMDAHEVPKLLELVRHGLRAERMVTPVANLIAETPFGVQLTSLGEALLKDRAE